jgi:exosome complex component MTR3
MSQAAFDRRRVNGPEESHPLVFESQHDQDLHKLRLGEPRRQRNSTDIRAICVCSTRDVVFLLTSYYSVLRPGLIDQSNGSAYVETEQTKIACAVSVPVSHCRPQHFDRHM